MSTTLQFLGAAGTVTGSRYLVESAGAPHSRGRRPLPRLQAASAAQPGALSGAARQPRCGSAHACASGSQRVSAEARCRWLHRPGAVARRARSSSADCRRPTVGACRRKKPLTHPASTIRSTPTRGRCIRRSRLKRAHRFKPVRFGDRLSLEPVARGDLGSGRTPAGRRADPRGEPGREHPLRET